MLRGLHILVIPGCFHFPAFCELPDISEFCNWGSK